MHCERDPACTYSEFVNKAEEETTCLLGVKDPEEKDKPTIGDDVFCYSKHGFGYKPHWEILEGMCQGFFPGYAILEPGWPVRQQCRERTNNALGLPNWDSDEKCNHWRPEFHLSAAGCWGRCKDNKFCLTAEYDHKTGDCELGLLPLMDHNPFMHRYRNAKTSCFAKYGYKNTTGWPGKTDNNERGYNVTEMQKMLEDHEWPNWDHSHDMLSGNLSSNMTDSSNTTNSTTDEDEKDKKDKDDKKNDDKKDDKEDKKDDLIQVLAHRKKHHHHHHHKRK